MVFLKALYLALTFLNIYINDLPNVSKILSFFLFVDDTNIYYESDNIKNLNHEINRELLKVKSWLEVNKLAPNVKKTNYVISCLPRRRVMENVSIKFGKKPVSRYGHVKFLGIIIDENLSWKYHITELTKKLSTTSGIFIKIRHFLPLDILKNLYYSIFSSFSFGSTTWGLFYDTYLEPLYLVQKRL